MAVFQIIAAVMAVMLIPICMICCNRLAISLIIDNEDDSDPSADDDKNLEIAHKLIVKTVSIERDHGNSTIECGNAEEISSDIANVDQPDDQKYSSLPLKRWLRKAYRRKNRWGTNYDSKNCSICLESYKDGEKIAGSKNPNCDHFFHLSCVAKWLRYRDECALCRARFVRYEKNHMSSN